MNLKKVLVIGGAVLGAGGLAWYVFRRPKVDPGLIAANATPTQGTPTVDSTLDALPMVAAQPPSASASPSQAGSGITAQPVGPSVPQFMSTSELSDYIDNEGRKLTHPSPLDTWVDQYVNDLEDASHIVDVLQGRA